MIWALDGFRRYAHARVITDLKNIADYYEERTLKASEKTKTKTSLRTTATRLQKTPEETNAGKRQKRAERRLWIVRIETQN